MTTFASFNLPAALLNNLNGLNITVPSPVQAGSIPAAIEGQDVLATAQTGSGKTIAFLIPMIMKIIAEPTSKALILVPTRELAIQVKDALGKLTHKMQGFKPIVIIGGESISRQFSQLERSPNIIIGTPGRICDHLDRETLDLSDVNFLVLDEIDRMLDMGFSQQLDVIYEYFQAERQTLMFSATLPPAIEKLSKKYLKAPIRVALGSSVKAAKEIKQETIQTTLDQKFALLEAQLDNRDGSIIVFGKTKWGVDKLVDQLKQKKHDVAAIHGGLQQRKRERVLQGFRKGDIRILVATDVAARGLDIPHVKHVINYDLPEGGEEYIHRIGRTGRAGMEGNAVSFLTKSDMRKWNDILYHMNGESGPSEKGRPGPRKGKSAAFDSRSEPRRSSRSGSPAFGAERRLASKAKPGGHFGDHQAQEEGPQPRRFKKGNVEGGAIDRAFAKPDFKRGRDHFGSEGGPSRPRTRSSEPFHQGERRGKSAEGSENAREGARRPRPAFGKPLDNPYAKKSGKFARGEKAHAAGAGAARPSGRPGSKPGGKPGSKPGSKPGFKFGNKAGAGPRGKAPSRSR